MENKKFRLTKNNLGIVQLIQQIVFINISTYNSLIDKDLSQETIRNNFELICNNYIRLNNPSSYIWGSELLNKINRYTIMKNLTPSEKYILIIDLEKDYDKCMKLGGDFLGKNFDPVSINIFNVQFMGE